MQFQIGNLTVLAGHAKIIYVESESMLMKEEKKDQKRIRGGTKYTVTTTERGIKINET